MRIYTPCKSGFSFWSTDKGKVYPILHAFTVYTSFLFLLYSLLCSTHIYFTHAHLPDDISKDVPYVPMPCSSVCTSLDSVQLLFFSKSRISSTSLCSRPRTNLLISLLLFLSGDVELNPGPPVLRDFLSIFSLNVRSATVINNVIDKPAVIQNFIMDKCLDFLFLTETWLSPDSPPSILNLLTPSGYSFHHVPRPSGRGGGIGCVYKSEFTLTYPTTPTYLSFEHMLVKFTCASKSFVILAIYRPPSASKSDFITELSELLENLASTTSTLVVLGDFNIHVDNVDDPFTSSFFSLLETFDLKQHIALPTHDSGHILDLIITRNSETLSQYGVTEPSLSDHSAVFCELPVSRKHQTSRVTKTF